MNDDRLGELLRRADEAVLPPAGPGDLAGRVKRARRRARIRQTTAALLCVGLGIGAIVRGYGRQTGKDAPSSFARVTLPPAAPVDVAALRAECARLGAEARQHAKLADELVRAEALSAKRRYAQEVLDRPDARTQLGVEVDAVAYVVRTRGDWLMSQPDGKAEAEQTYRRVVELFPDSGEAAVAREQLKRFKVEA